MFKPLPKWQLKRIVNRVLALENKKQRLLDILFEEDEKLGWVNVKYLNSDIFRQVKKLLI